MLIFGATSLYVASPEQYLAHATSLRHSERLRYKFVEVKSTRRASGSEGAVRVRLSGHGGKNNEVAEWGGIAVVHVLVGNEAGNVVTGSWS